MNNRTKRASGLAVALLMAGALTCQASAQTPATSAGVVQVAAGPSKVGTASVVSSRLSGRQMADGERFHSNGTAAASRDLPLGTKAKVTNLKTGKSAIVTIKDRGPFRKGRSLDVSKGTANQIGITRKDGVAPVKVTPVAAPTASASR